MPLQQRRSKVSVANSCNQAACTIISPAHQGNPTGSLESSVMQEPGTESKRRCKSGSLRRIWMSTAPPRRLIGRRHSCLNALEHETRRLDPSSSTHWLIDMFRDASPSRRRCASQNSMKAGSILNRRASLSGTYPLPRTAVERKPTPQLNEGNLLQLTPYTAKGCMGMMPHLNRLCSTACSTICSTAIHRRSLY